MKNKPLTYVLIISVILIWGYVLKRLIDSSGAQPKRTPVFIEKERPEYFAAIKQDQETLAIKYDDPFLKNDLKKGLDQGKKTLKKDSLKTRLPVQRRTPDTSFIKFLEPSS